MADSPLVLHIKVLGPPEVQLGENQLNFPTRKTLALLIYLAVEAGAQPREHLSVLLWPDASPERSYANLRNTLGHLQTGLRFSQQQAQNPYLIVTHNSLELNPEASVRLDLHMVEQAYALARADRSSRTLPEGSASLPALRSAAACQRGDFLAGFSLGDAPAFDDWAGTQREAWRRRLGLVLDRLSEIQFAHGEFSEVTETASQWIALDALNESAYRRKMRAHFSAGERGQALETYEACRALLKSELGIAPEPDTVALAERIRTQASPVQTHAQRAKPQPNRPDTSVAFLGNLFAGRDKEYQALVQSYAQAAAGQPRLVVLHGDTGIGKTRLARKFLAWAEAQGTELLQGSAFESGSHLPFQPLVEALRRRLEDGNSPTDFLMEAGFSQLIKLLPELSEYHPGPPSNTSVAPVPDQGVSQTQLFESFTQLTLALAQRAPLVLFLDDLQWADSATLDLLHYAVRRWKDSAAPSSNARVLLLVSVRSEALLPMSQPKPAGRLKGLAQWIVRVARELSPVYLELEPLGESETVKMVVSILEPSAADFAEWLYAETHGHPFYLMETLKDLLERRVLHPKPRSETQWTFTLDSDHDLGHAVRVPSTVHAVIRSRLRRLSPNAFSLLVGGAVLEQQITFGHLCAISNVTEDLALPALDEALSGRLLLESVQPGIASAYVFTNDMLRDVVYTEAGDARRRLFHRRALEILEAEGVSAAVLAHHALASGLIQAAYHHSLTAGREALRLSAASEAVIHFERSMQLVRESMLPEVPGKTELQDLVQQLRRAYELDGQVEKAVALRSI